MKDLNSFDLGTFNFSNLKTIVNYSKGDGKRKPLDKNIQAEVLEIFDEIAPSIDTSKWSKAKQTIYYLSLCTGSWLFNHIYKEDIIKDVGTRIDSSIKKNLHIERKDLKCSLKDIKLEDVKDKIINDWYKNDLWNSWKDVHKDIQTRSNEENYDRKIKFNKTNEDDIKNIQSCKEPSIQKEFNDLDKKFKKLSLSDDKGFAQLETELKLLSKKATAIKEIQNEIDVSIKHIQAYKDEWAQNELTVIVYEYLKKTNLTDSDYQELKTKSSKLVEIVKQLQKKDSEKQKISEDKKVTSSKYGELLKSEKEYQNKLLDLEKIKIKIAEIENNINTFEIGRSESQKLEEVKYLNLTRKSSILSLGNFLDGEKLKEYTKNKTDLNELHLKIAAAEESVNTYKPFRLEKNRQIEIKEKNDLLEKAEEIQNQSKSLVDATIKEKRDSLNKQIEDHDKSISKIDVEIQLIKDQYNGKPPTETISDAPDTGSDIDSNRSNSPKISSSPNVDNIEKLKEILEEVQTTSSTVIQEESETETTKPGLRTWEELTNKEKKQFKQFLINHPACNLPELYKSFGDSKSAFNQFLIDANSIISDALFGKDRKGKDILGIQQLSDMSKLWIASGSEKNGIDKYDEKGFDDAVGYIYDYYIKIAKMAKNETSLTEILNTLQHVDIYYETKNLKTHKVVQKPGAFFNYTPDIKEIANDYGVNVDVLLKFNPKIKIDSKLVLGTELKIPLPKQRMVNLNKLSALKNYPGFLDARGNIDSHPEYNKCLTELLNNEDLSNIPQDVKLLLVDFSYWFGEMFNILENKNFDDKEFITIFDKFNKASEFFNCGAWIGVTVPLLGEVSIPRLLSSLTNSTIKSTVPKLLKVLDYFDYGIFPTEIKTLEATIKEIEDPKNKDTLDVKYLEKLKKDLVFAKTEGRQKFNSKGIEKSKALFDLTIFDILAGRHDVSNITKIAVPLSKVFIAVNNYSLVYKYQSLQKDVKDLNNQLKGIESTLKNSNNLKVEDKKAHLDKKAELEGKIKYRNECITKAQDLISKIDKNIDKSDDYKINAYFKNQVQEAVSEFITKLLPIFHTVSCEIGKDEGYKTVLTKADTLIKEVSKNKELLPEVFPAEKLDVFMQKLLQIIK